MDYTNTDFCSLCSAAFSTYKFGSLIYTRKGHKLSPQSCRICAIVEFGCSARLEKGEELSHASTTLHGKLLCANMRLDTPSLA